MSDERKNHDPGPRPFADLSVDETGLLWLINRVCFHPRGYALALHRDDDGEVVGWGMFGDGTEVWTFTTEDDDKCFAKVNAYFAPERIKCAQHFSCDASKSYGGTGWVHIAGAPEPEEITDA